MTQRPEYFDRIKQAARDRWDQLEEDPELAGPWHQLFKQVQSPRHVVSELLQNADDAGATEARVAIKANRFTFEHNGEDFTEEHFHSLCRFGYSNKRNLHTIGFRGIGFKSTFSLGNVVELASPTLSVVFERDRFTEPHWDPRESVTDWTRVQVLIADTHRAKELGKNLDEWVRSPVSLLFFRSIRTLRIRDRVLRWESLGPGPVPGSEWMRLSGADEGPFLHLESSEAPFPDECLAEIRNERLVPSAEELDLPPSRVELVLGGKGRLHVVLGTGVVTKLPFAVNAPFIQDPARLKIKDPEISPTNRWLLSRVGQLAGSSLVKWIGSPALDNEDRAGAYSLLPERPADDEGVESSCERSVDDAFWRALSGKPLLLGDDGTLSLRGNGVFLDAPLFRAWPRSGELARLMAAQVPVLSRHVKPDARRKLLECRCAKAMDRSRFVGLLRKSRLPKPDTWTQLLALWEYVFPEFKAGYYAPSADDLMLVPVQGRSDLHAPSEVVRLGRDRILKSEDDWDFLAAFFIAVDPEWLRFLAEASGSSVAAQASTDLLAHMGLGNATSAAGLIEKAAERLLEETGDSDSIIRLAQIAAHLDVPISQDFCYVTSDDQLVSAEAGVVADPHGRLAGLLPQGTTAGVFLSNRYWTEFRSCSADEWREWSRSDKSRLLGHIPLQPRPRPVFGRAEAEDLAKAHEVGLPLEYHYKTDHFHGVDWDFPDDFWAHWHGLEDDNIWPELLRPLLQSAKVAKEQSGFRIYHVSTTGRRRESGRSAGVPSWIRKFRNVGCLRDTKGFLRLPYELVLRTPETEPLADVEPFVEVALDNGATRFLLENLGVRTKPTGPDGIIERLRALSRAHDPPVREVLKWYERLDQLLHHGGRDAVVSAREAFNADTLIWTEQSSWERACNVFVAADEHDVPGAAVVHQDAVDLSLWRRVGVADRPTVESAMEWLVGLPRGERLPDDDLRRLRSLAARHASRVWDEVGCWVNLLGEWVSINELEYLLGPGGGVPWEHLDDSVLRETARTDFLRPEQAGSEPFTELVNLGAVLEERTANAAVLTSSPDRQEWTSVVGECLARVNLDTDAETQRVRSEGLRLSRTTWWEADDLQVVPHIDGVPVGTPRVADVVWLADRLCVGPLPRGKLAKRVPEEVGRVFARPDIKAALAFAYDRSPVDIESYLQENFDLAANVESSEGEFPERPEGGMGTGPAHVPESQMPPGADPVEIGGVDPLSPPDERDTYETPTEPRAEWEDAEEHPEESSGSPAVEKKPTVPSLQARYLAALGFKADGNRRFVRGDGAWVGPTSDSVFPMQRVSPLGDVEAYFWVKDACVQRESVEIAADRWSLLQASPDIYYIVLADANGGPVEYSGSELQRLVAAGELRLHPSTYRLGRNTSGGGPFNQR